MTESSALPPKIGSTWLDWDGDECRVVWVGGDMADLRYDDGSTWHTPWAEVLTQMVAQS